MNIVLGVYFFWEMVDYNLKQILRSVCCFGNEVALQIAQIYLFFFRCLQYIILITLTLGNIDQHRTIL